MSIATASQTFCRMVGQDQFHYGFPGIHHAWAVCLHNHPFHTLRFTGRSQITATFYFNYADTASTRIIFIVQIFQLHIAKSRNADTHSFCSIQDRGSFGDFHWFSIYNKLYCFHTFNCHCPFFTTLVHINSTELTSLYT